MLDRSSRTRSRSALRASRSSSLAACLCAAAALAACEDSFEPITPSALAFSVFGYLDAAADTQWIRVMPLRALRVTSRDPLGTQVTLEHLESAQVIELRDSLVRFWRFLDLETGSQGTFVHNFWTPEGIQAGAAYRFRATREGEEPAEAVIVIPRDYEVEVDIDQAHASYPPDDVRITGVKHVAFFTTIARFYDDCGLGATRTVYERSSSEDEVHVLAVGKTEAIPREGCGHPRVETWEFWIVGSQAAWPTTGYSPGALGESALTSNVTNAVGFLGGVLIRTIPYEACGFRSVGTPIPEYCRLRYTRETATLTGSVSDPVCGGAPRPVMVRLTEQDRDPARIRTAFATRAGQFLVGALEPGIPHVLQAVTPQTVVDGVPTDVYAPFSDTLTFTPGEHVTYDIQLERLTPCRQPLSMAQ